MRKSFVLWGIAFVLSILATEPNFENWSVAFFHIHIIIQALIVLKPWLLWIVLFWVIGDGSATKNLSMLLVILAILRVSTIAILAGLLSKVFGVDMYLTYAAISLAWCFLV